jgi:uncharacterized protein YtpQ (UPF0354 family)
MSNINPTQRFLEQVLTILREEYPGETFTADMENEGSLKHEGFTLCLANLWSQYQQHLMDEKAQENTEVLRSLTKHFVQAMLNAPAGIGKRLSWAEAASKLYPFIVNMVTVRNLERDAGCPHFQLGGELALTLVLDFPDCIRYVLEPDLKDWNMAFEEALTRGLQNLDKLPVKLETVGKPPNGVVCLSTFDGYAGTRILAPGAQRKIGKILGFPFYFGIPYRDFLCCWSNRASEEVKLRVRMRLAKDHQSKDHAISEHVYQVQAPGQLVAQDPKETVHFLGNITVIVSSELMFSPRKPGSDPRRF